MNQEPPFFVILNASAGTARGDGGGDVERQVAEGFRAAGADARIVTARNGDELVTLAAEAVREGYATVVAGGGDGTVSSVASQLVGTEARLGVLPLGTLNHFAKDLRIPLDPAEAARTIVEGEEKRVDVGAVNDRIFINNSSLGLYPLVVRNRERQQKREGRGKWYAFARAAFSTLRRYPFLRLRLTSGGETLARRTPLVFIGNNEYEVSGFQLGGRACLDAGCLALYVANNVNRLRLARLALAAIFGRDLGEAPDFDRLCVAEVTIESRRNRLLVATDGEVNVMETPLRYRVRRGELRVIAPRGEDAGAG